MVYAMNPRIVRFRANARATGRRGWTPHEDTKLTSAVSIKSKAKHGMSPWGPALTSGERKTRWHVALGARVDRW
jgi:hypothetical protein